MYIQVHIYTYIGEMEAAPPPPQPLDTTMYEQHKNLFELIGIHVTRSAE